MQNDSVGIVLVANNLSCIIYSTVYYLFYSFLLYLFHYLSFIGYEIIATIISDRFGTVPSCSSIMSLGTSGDM